MLIINRSFQKKERHFQKTKKIGVFFLFVLFLGSFFWFKKEKKIETKNENSALVEEKKELEKKEKLVKYLVTEGDLPADVFSQYGKLDANDMEKLLSSTKDVYDFSKIKIGRELKFYFIEETKAKRIEYDLDTERKIIVERIGEDFQIREEKIPYEIKEETIKIKIDEFLYKDALDAGFQEASILEIADIFSFDVDFTTEIQTGDELIIVYEKRTLNGESAPDGKILAAKFINAGQEYFAYYFESEGEGNYYDAEGKELQRQFLRAPLSYRKITSGYTGARLHPITKKISAHYQIDYAAPVGTPVLATARGTVSSAGWEGGWGNMVRLKHDNGYTTHYGHLSAYGKGIKAGVSVSQGQVIGYVGSTGWSTGPHLDYGMKLNDNPINPLSLKLPKGESLKNQEKDKFDEIKNRYKQNWE